MRQEAQSGMKAGKEGREGVEQYAENTGKERNKKATIASIRDDGDEQRRGGDEDGGQADLTGQGFPHRALPAGLPDSQASKTGLQEEKDRKTGGGGGRGGVCTQRSRGTEAGTEHGVGIGNGVQAAE